MLTLFCNILQPLLNLLNVPLDFSSGIISGILEMTTGLNIISNIHIKKLSINIIISSFILGLGGFSILLQVWSTISKTDLSIKPYILGKFLQAIFSALYTFIFLQNFTIFNFDL